MNDDLYYIVSHFDRHVNEKIWHATRRPRHFAKNGWVRHASVEGFQTREQALRWIAMFAAN